jgi:hypothetical protein
MRVWCAGGLCGIVPFFYVKTLLSISISVGS